jgi:hypothetical protein
VKLGVRIGLEMPSRPMKKIILLTIAVAGAFASGYFWRAALRPTSEGATVSVTQQAEAITLADACRLTRLMNEGKWDEVKEALGAEGQFFGILRAQAERKDWPGMGAYLGSEVLGKSPFRVSHAFGFAPRTNPHRIALSYTVTDGGMSNPSLMVFGW